MSPVDGYVFFLHDLLSVHIAMDNFIMRESSICNGCIGFPENLKLGLTDWLVYHDRLKWTEGHVMYKLLRNNSHRISQTSHWKRREGREKEEDKGEGVEEEEEEEKENKREKSGEKPWECSNASVQTMLCVHTTSDFFRQLSLYKGTIR